MGRLCQRRTGGGRLLRQGRCRDCRQHRGRRHAAGQPQRTGQVRSSLVSRSSPGNIPCDRTNTPRRSRGVFFCTRLFNLALQWCMSGQHGVDPTLEI